MINNIIGKNNFFELTKKLIEKSHFFIKEKSDISSVSLRDINRFGKMYKFFNEYLEKRKRYSNDKEIEIEKDSIILSLYFCYYLRIPTMNLRKEYINEIKKIEDIPFEQISDRESEFITNIILEGKKGYAKNKALKENLFCEFVCLINKEPLIICGKPGSSKSLSVQLIIDAMEGNKYSHEFFKQYDKVIPSFYQCSITSNSESVQKLFDRARNKLEKMNFQ